MKGKKVVWVVIIVLNILVFGGAVVFILSKNFCYCRGNILRHGETRKYGNEECECSREGVVCSKVEDREEEDKEKNCQKKYENELYPNFSFYYDSCKYELSEKEYPNEIDPRFKGRKIEIEDEDGNMIVFLFESSPFYGSGGAGTCYEEEVEYISDRLVRLSTDIFRERLSFNGKELDKKPQYKYRWASKPESVDRGQIYEEYPKENFEEYTVCFVPRDYTFLTVSNLKADLFEVYDPDQYLAAEYKIFLYTDSHDEDFLEDADELVEGVRYDEE